MPLCSPASSNRFFRQLRTAWLTRIAVVAASRSGNTKATQVVCRAIGPILGTLPFGKVAEPQSNPPPYRKKGRR